MSTDKLSELRKLFSKRLDLAMNQVGYKGRGKKKALSEAMKKEGFPLSATAVANIIKGAIPGSDILFGLSLVLQKQMDWFFGREREIIRPPELVIEKVPQLKTYGKFDRLALRNYLPIPLLRQAIAAGTPSEINEFDDIQDWVLIYASRDWMPHDPENYTCAHVQGNSMAPILEDGDIVAIDHADREPRNLNNKMVAFRIDGGVTVKWLNYDPGSPIIIGHPENRFRKDSRLIIPIDDAYEHVVGRVAWWWAKR